MRIKKKICLWAMLAFALAFFVNLSGEPAQAAEKIPISSAQELGLMEKNPSGSYYLTEDIDVPVGTRLFYSSKKFTGTFDGNGHTLRNYKVNMHSSGSMAVALFTYADGAKFKNLTISGVDIDVDADEETAYAAALVAVADNCSFSNIKVNNMKIHVDAASGGAYIGGLAAWAGLGTTFNNIQVSGSVQAKGRNDQNVTGGLTIAGVAVNGEKYVKCRSSVNVTMDVSDMYNPQTVAGIAAGYGGVIKDCSYSGKINIKAKVYGLEDLGVYAAGIATYAVQLKNCKNSGTIKANVEGCTQAAGIVNELRGAEKCSCTGCKNSGSITLTTKGPTTPFGLVAAGVVGTAERYPISKCANTGKITVKEQSNGMAMVGGIGGDVCYVSQSYNTGAIKATFGKQLGRVKFVGGVAGSVLDLRNSYNTGAVTLSGEGMVGGLAGHTEGFDERVIYNYSTGKVKGSRGAFAGNLIGEYSGPSAVNPVRMSYDCYYTRSGRDIGSSAVDWHEWTAKNKKVSSITSSSCPKLSSKYWKYSGSAKRLILKNNPEK